MGTKKEKKKKKRKNSDVQANSDTNLFEDKLPVKRPRKVLDPKLKYYKVVYTDGRATKDFQIQTCPETTDSGVQICPKITQQYSQTENVETKDQGTQFGRSLPFDIKLEDMLKASIKVHLNSSLKNLKLDI